MSSGELPAGRRTVEALALHKKRQSKIKMDAGVRRNDEPKKDRTAKSGCRSEHSRSEWPGGRAADAASNDERRVTAPPQESGTRGFGKIASGTSGRARYWLLRKKILIATDL